jgi:hypothetical protein
MKETTESGTTFLSKEEQEAVKKIRPPEMEVITESEIPSIQIEPTLRRKTDSKLHQFTTSIESGWIRFMDWFKKSIATMIIFILLGGAGGLYLAKIVYDFRMTEVTMIGGFVHDGRVYDAKLRP